MLRGAVFLLFGCACAVPTLSSERHSLHPHAQKHHKHKHTKARRRYAGEVVRTSLWASLPHHPASSGAPPRSSSSSSSSNISAGTSLVGSELPSSFTWANVSGVSYLTPMRNQHIPVYCGSCWAFASTSCFADRWNVANRNTGSPIPNIMLSTQHVLSCGNEAVGCGTCEGGDELAVYQYAEEHGVSAAAVQNAGHACRSHRSPALQLCSSLRAVAPASPGSLQLPQFSSCGRSVLLWFVTCYLTCSAPPLRPSAPLVRYRTSHAPITWRVTRRATAT